MTRLCRRMTLHFSQIGLTLGFTFIAVPSSTANAPGCPRGCACEIVEAIFCLLVPVDDPTARQVVGRELHDDAVLRQDADVVLTHLARDVSENLVAVGQFDPE